MTKLTEGLKENDLESLVLPLLSVDEYESKLDDDSIVIAFYVKDKEPAQDLNRFIQKGAQEILDTDVSPAPTEDGNYMVFVEVLRDKEFPGRCIDMLTSLTGLTGIENWMLSIYDEEEHLPADLQTLEAKVRLYSMEDYEDDAEEDEEMDVDEALTEFFHNSDLEGLKVDGRTVTLEGLVSDYKLELIDLGVFDQLIERNVVLTQGLRLDEAAQHNVSRLKALLGDLWVVEHLHNHVLLSNLLSEDVALFRL